MGSQGCVFDADALCQGSVLVADQLVGAEERLHTGHLSTDQCELNILKRDVLAALLALQIEMTQNGH